MYSFRTVVVGLIAWVILSVPGHALIERKIERSFPAGEFPVLTVDATDGEINVRTVPGGGEIKITVIQTVDTADPAEGERRFAAVELDIGAQTPGGVRLVSRFKRGHAWLWQTWPPASLSYEVVVPERCDVDIRLDSGTITLGDVEGRVVLVTDSAAIYAQEVDGSFKARSKSGGISLAACTGDIDARGETSAITVGRAAGRTTVASRGGFMEVQRVSGPIVVRGDGSDALVGFVAPTRDAADIVLSGGSLTLRLDNNAAGTLDLRSSIFGKIDLRGEVPMVIDAGGVGKSRLLADINGGGPRLRARVHGGSLLVRALDPVPAE